MASVKLANRDADYVDPTIGLHDWKITLTPCMCCGELGVMSFRGTQGEAELKSTDMASKCDKCVQKTS